MKCDNVDDTRDDCGHDEDTKVNEHDDMITTIIFSPGWRSVEWVRVTVIVLVNNSQHRDDFDGNKDVRIRMIMVG